MNLLAMIVLAGVLLAAAFYAQQQIPSYTSSRRNVLITRALLASVGLACGIVSSALYADDTATALLAFVAGFGAVHIPAAFILLIKRGRGAGPT